MNTQNHDNYHHNDIGDALMNAITQLESSAKRFEETAADIEDRDWEGARELYHIAAEKRRDAAVLWNSRVGDYL